MYLSRPFPTATPTDLLMESSGVAVQSAAKSPPANDTPMDLSKSATMAQSNNQPVASVRLFRPFADPPGSRRSDAAEWAAAAVFLHRLLLAWPPPPPFLLPPPNATQHRKSRRPLSGKFVRAGPGASRPVLIRLRSKLIRRHLEISNSRTS